MNAHKRGRGAPMDRLGLVPSTSPLAPAASPCISGQSHAKPRNSNWEWAEVSHVSIKCFAAGHGEKGPADHNEC